jgi:membrane-associated phospholipid phosphatase
MNHGVDRQKENEDFSPEESRLGVSEWLSVFLNNYRHILWAVAIAAGLILFFQLVPAYYRTSLLRGMRSHQLLVSLLFMFNVIALSLVWTTGRTIDAWAFLRFNLRKKPPVWLDWIMLAITQLGNGIAASLVALVLFSLGDRRLAYELILGLLTLWLLVELIKALIRRSRPYVRLVQTRIVGYRERGHSFPSGHTSQAFFIVTLLVQHYHPSLFIAILLYVLASLVAITRMYVGAHYPRDVLAGAMLGSSWGLLVVIVNSHIVV